MEQRLTSAISKNAKLTSAITGEEMNVERTEAIAKEIKALFKNKTI